MLPPPQAWSLAEKGAASTLDPLRRHLGMHGDRRVELRAEEERNEVKLSLLRI